jgi:hypothetical protein
MTPQGPTLSDLQGYLTAINRALGDPTLTVRYPDGRSVTFRTTDELIKAKATLEDQIRNFGGGHASKSTLAQHRRGDGPFGPGFPGPGFCR